MRKITNHLKRDPVLGAIIERVGKCSISFREPTFSALVGSIVSQQLSTKVAAIIFARLVAAAPNQQLTPTSILALSPVAMRALGLSTRKVEYIRDLAQHAQSGSLDFAALPSMEDQAVIDSLTQIKGIGVWTAHMFLLFALRRPDVLAVGDLGIRSAIRKAYALPDLPSPAEVERYAENWRPYCSVACWYLWRSLDGPAKLL